MFQLFKRTVRKGPTTRVLGTVLLLFAASSAHATLGGQPGGSGLTRATAQHRAVTVAAMPTTQAYTTQESTTDAGTVVREYVGTDGVVFAVVWNGPFMPNLSTLLGEYFPQYTSKAVQQSPSHNVRLFNNSNLVVQSTGHMHAFSGMAYLPQKLPAGVTADSLK